MMDVCFPEGHEPEIIEAANELAHGGAHTPILWRQRGHRLPSEDRGVKVESCETNAPYANYRSALDALNTSRAQILVAGANLPKNRLLAIIFEECATSRNEPVFGLAHVEWLTERKREFCLLDPCVTERCRISVLADLVERAIPFARHILHPNDIHVCFLAHSTGSTGRKSVRRQCLTIETLRRRGVDEVLADPMQLDAALDPHVRYDKLGCCGGEPNLLVFPDITSANLVYKAIETFASDRALLSGAILCGLPRGAIGILPRSPSADLVLRAVYRLVHLVEMEMRDVG